MCVVIDTNLWISFLFGKEAADLLSFLQERRVEIVIDERQIAEIENVLSRQKIRKLVGTRRVAIFRRFIRGNTKLIKPKRQIRVCRDPDDDYLLEIATKRKAAFLVSGDNDLLVLDPFRSIRIESYRDFR